MFWLDTLFGKSYGDGSGDPDHYVTDEVINRMTHNNEIRIKMREAIEKKRKGELSDNEFNMEIDRLHNQFI